MVTPRIKYRPPLTTHLVSAGVLRTNPFSLIDVGASGGIEQHWEVFGDSLTAIGFEPLIAEANRLNAAAPPNIRYEAALVTSRDQATAHAVRVYADPIAYRDNQPFPRTSAVRASALRKLDYAKTYYDPSGSGAVSELTVTLDEIYRQRRQRNVDFIKIDTDGHDYYALRGANEMLSASPVLGVFIECQFHGPVHHRANLFSNIDHYLHARGFTLFDLEVYRYSRAVLPKPFMYNLPANTRAGQVVWGEALYARDGGDPDYEKKWGLRLSELKLCKLACIFEIFGLEDCAAELLWNYRERLQKLVDVDRSLDLLTPPHNGKRLTFRQYNEVFEKRMGEWFP